MSYIDFVETWVLFYNNITLNYITYHNNDIIFDKNLKISCYNVKMRRFSLPNEKLTLYFITLNESALKRFSSTNQFSYKIVGIFILFSWIIMKIFTNLHVLKITAEDCFNLLCFTYIHSFINHVLLHAV